MCSECGQEKIFKVPDGFTWCQGESPTKAGERGAWLVFTEDNPAEGSDSPQGGKSTKAGGSGEGSNMDIS